MAATIHELSRVAAWLYSTLSADATLTSLAPGGVFRGLAPVGTATPYVVFSYQGGADMNSMTGYRLGVNSLWMVKAVGPASSTPTLQSAADRIETLLGHKSGTVAGAIIAACIRQDGVFDDEVVNGALWTNVGGIYRIWAEAI